MNDVSILGLGESGSAAARLVLNKGGRTYVSDSHSDATTSARGAELRALGARVELGGHDLDRIARSDTVVASPGIPPDAPVLRALRELGIPWISEPELAVRFFRGPLIAVTGTNGKTTTCAAMAHLLETGGVSVGLGGNIGAGLGPAASELALREPAPSWYILEVSSFQLADIETFRPDIGVITNLAPDHLDRYDTVEDYYRDKARIFENADSESRWVLNADDVGVERMAGDAPGRRWHFSLERDDIEGGTLRDGALTLQEGGEETRLIKSRDLPLLGRHNVANALAASVAAHLAGVEADAIARGLCTIEPLPHRLEPVADVGGVLWVNDSKATNVAAAVSAVKSLADRPLVVLLGGKDKGEELEPLVAPLMQSARRVLTYGAAAGRIFAALDGQLPVERVTGSFQDVVERAHEIARRGDAVLLTPACSSFDMFDNYEARGRDFARLARELVGNGEAG